MDIQTLAALEAAIEPYRRAGFVVTSQSEGSIILSYPSGKFSYFAFIFWLVLFWPIALIYLISYNNRKSKSVCVRITSQGYIEESGYTLKVIEDERRRDRRIGYIAITIIALIVLAILVRILLAS
jgi:predicted nucleic acid-binding Zn ribbon protein